MTGFVLREVDDATWARFKARAKSEGHSMRWVLVALVTHYITHGLPKGKG